MRTLQPSELRIGNLANYKYFNPAPDGCTWEFSTATIVALHSAVKDTVAFRLRGDKRIIKIGELHPIPLTEEWLVRFGLDLTTWFCEGSYLVVKDEEFGWCMKVRNASQTREIEFGYFRYVHQLQNLYFALTGEELTLKQTDNI